MMLTDFFERCFDLVKFGAIMTVVFLLGRGFGTLVMWAVRLLGGF